MAFGIHWEWRGFGAVSSRFSSRFCALAPQRETHYIEDTYLWIPGLDFNIKLREGAEAGLKFKRKMADDGRLELWSEDPEDVFSFPLGKEAWDKLRRATRPVGLPLPPYSAAAADRAQVLAILEEHGCKLVPVQKWREGRLWQGRNGPVFVEWTCVHGPQVIITIGLESMIAGQDTDDGEARLAKDDLETAFKGLGLDAEPLVTMNFVTAVALWAGGRQVSA